MPDPTEVAVAFRAIAHNVERMAQSMKNVALLLGNDDNKKRKREVKLSDPLKPERPQSAYNQFVKDNFRRQSTEDKGTNRETLAALGQKWKQLVDNDKTHYQELAAQDKQRYEREMKEFLVYRQQHPFDPDTEGMSALSRKKQRKLAYASDPSPNVEDINEQPESANEDQVPVQEPQQSPPKVSMVKTKPTKKKNNKKTKNKNKNKQKKLKKALAARK
ncbi:high mobility group box domain-containing protein [Fennellomyces sp. T-0311]|nr:high mobility group box domain-containing protein [Fennellomyces sp. T-0311]